MEKLLESAKRADRKDLSWKTNAERILNVYKSIYIFIWLMSAIDIPFVYDFRVKFLTDLVSQDEIQSKIKLMRSFSCIFQENTS